MSLSKIIGSIFYHYVPLSKFWLIKTYLGYLDMIFTCQGYEQNESNTGFCSLMSQMIQIAAKANKLDFSSQILQAFSFNHLLI